MTSTPVDWRPTLALETAHLRATLKQRVRAWFDDHPALEVDTPLLSDAAVSDPNIESVSGHVSALGRPHWLHTSPEYPMKRLLAAGYPDIYQLCPVFRDGEVGHRHQPEFTMLEWYRHGASLADISSETARLIQHLLTGSAAEPSGVVHHRYDDALQSYCGMTSRSSLDALQCAAGHGFPEALLDQRDALLDFIFATQVATEFDARQLTVITHYPASQAALAIIDKDGFALRFEVFLGALELANGFVELRDAEEQQQRFAMDQQQRAQRGQPVRPIDEAFLAALAHGLPDCAGVAVGFDRIVMSAAGLPSIDRVVSFAHRHRGPA